MDIPIFFLCSDLQQYYVASCTDIDELNYIVVKLRLSEVYNLLHGKIPMRDVILKQKEYWDVMSGEKIVSDIVVKRSIDEIELEALPEKTACFKILTEQMRLYVQKFDGNFLQRSIFRKVIKKRRLIAIMKNINQFKEN